MMKIKIKLTVLAACMTVAASANAAVSPQEAAKLNGTLTPWGAEKGANKDGTIPAHGERVKPPSNWDPKKPGIRPDPFASEKPLYSIDAKNMDKYADKLSAGVKAMLVKYPTFRLDVYPTHRTMQYPKWYQDNSIKNATACKTSPDGVKLEGCYGGTPFPIPKNGIEVMWNHSLVFLAAKGMEGTFTAWYVPPSGKAVLQGENPAVFESPFFDEDQKGPNPSDTPIYRFRMDTTGPARKAGERLIQSIGADGKESLWQYLPGQRRVKLSPDLSYDTPNPQSGGASTMDEVRVFQGALDRFDFKLVGTKEMIMPYNVFKMYDQKSCPIDALFQPGHYNSNCVRWELHRTWVVEAVVKPGKRHIYPKRTFYFDEDIPNAGMGDNYDASGKLYRTTISFPMPFYEVDGVNPMLFGTFDVSNGAYLSCCFGGSTGGLNPTMKKASPTYFTPDALANSGIR